MGQLKTGWNIKTAKVQTRTNKQVHKMQKTLVHWIPPPNNPLHLFGDLGLKLSALLRQMHRIALQYIRNDLFATRSWEDEVSGRVLLKQLPSKEVKTGWNIKTAKVQTRTNQQVHKMQKTLVHRIPPPNNPLHLFGDLGWSCRPYYAKCTGSLFDKIKWCRRISSTRSHPKIMLCITFLLNCSSRPNVIACRWLL